MAATVQTITASVKTGSGKPKANKAGTLSINISAKDAAAQPIVIRASITGKAKTGQHIVANLTPNCIPPGKPSDTPPCQGKEAPIQSFTLATLAKHKGSGSKRHDLVTTPPSCPSKGWTFGVTVTFRAI